MSMDTAKRSLNILEVGSAFPGWGGTEIHLLHLSEQLIKRGHRVTVACRPGKFVEAECQKRNLPTFALTIKNQTDWKQAPILWRRLKSDNYDVVHVHWSPDYLVPALLARWAKVPVVLMSHHSPHPFKNNFRRRLIRRTYNRLIALSESVRTMLVETQAMPPEQVVTIHHGTDTEAFRQTTLPPESIRSEWGLPPDTFVVGIAGRIGREKGITVLINALALLTERGDTRTHLVIIGSGPQEAETREAVSAQNLSSRVTFAGFRSDANNAINALHVLVLASTWAEPCAAVVQQAMALGKPVIGTRSGGTPEMIAENETGLLVPINDAEALAEALVQIRDMPLDARETMGEAGRSRVEAHFTLRGMVDKIESLYHAQFEAAQSAQSAAPSAPPAQNKTA